jgi:hypothetical protein
MTSPADCCVRVAEQALTIASAPVIAMILMSPPFMFVSCRVANLPASCNACAIARSDA